MTQIRTVSTSTKKPSAAARMEALRLPVARMADRIAAKEALRKIGARQADARLSKADRRRAKLDARTPLTARDRDVAVITREVADPYLLGGKIKVEANRRIDVLNDERARGLGAPTLPDGSPKFGIDEACFLVGRDIQATYEKAALHSMPGMDWSGGDRVNANAAHESHIEKAVHAAHAVTIMERDLVPIVGAAGLRLLRMFLTTNIRFGEYAASIGRFGDRGANSIAERFRWMLGDIADSRAAEGKGARTPNDKHAAVARTVSDRSAPPAAS